MIPGLPASIAGARARILLEGVRAWAADRPDVAAVALVGSWARGTARPDSDIDLVIVTHDVAGFFAFPGWLAHFGKPTDRIEETYGVLRALRVWYADGPEVEFGVVPPSWCATDPVDSGTAGVVLDGLVALYDPVGVLARLVGAVNLPPPTPFPGR